MGVQLLSAPAPFLSRLYPRKVLGEPVPFPGDALQGQTDQMVFSPLGKTLTIFSATAAFVCCQHMFPLSQWDELLYAPGYRW